MLLHKLEKHNGCVNCLNFNKAGNLLVTGSDDLKVIVWNWAKQQPILVQMSGHRSNVFQSKFIDNGTATNQKDFHLITSARDGEVRQIQVDFIYFFLLLSRIDCIDLLTRYCFSCSLYFKRVN